MYYYRGAYSCYHTNVLPNLSFNLPWVLLALPLLLLLPRRSGRLWRILSLALLITALAQPTLNQASRNIAILIDVSDSLGDSALNAAKTFDTSTLKRDPNIFYFAADSSPVASVSEDVPGFIDRSKTDIARALQVAVASGAKRLLLLSDGAQSSGDALLALPGVPVDTFITKSRDNVRLSSLLAREQASPGETVEVVAIVESDRDTTVTLYPQAGDVALEPVQKQLKAGRNPVSFSFQIPSADTVHVSARVQADFEQPVTDDTQEIDIAVSDNEPVLVINDPAFSELLRTQGFDVITGSPADITGPLNYSAIILREGSGQFTTGQLSLLESFVLNGGGFMMTGGPESFGFGAWYRTPVEEVLPVHTDLRTEVELPLVAMVIVMDRSQSMSTGQPSKIDLAKEGAISVVDLAYQDDLLGLIVFSDEASTEWAFRLRRATDQGKREMFEAIVNIGTQGGTVLAPAYTDALSTLEVTDAAIKHVIILSDGKLYDGGGVFGGSSTSVDFNTIAQRALEAGITTSTIAIGDGADFERLESMARSGGGRYYEALDVTTLPQIFTSEALTATRSLLREEPLRPTLIAHPLIPAGTPQPPALNAYIATNLKDEAETLLEGDLSEPILAVSRKGLGRSAAFTTDLNAWSGDLGRWDDLPALLGTVVRWLQTRPADYSATVRKEGTNLRVVVDAVKDGEYINDKNLLVRYNGVQQPLEQVAPGRYEGLLDVTADGGTVLVIDQDEVVARAQVSAPNAEFDTRDAHVLMQSIAELSGGSVIEEAGVYAPVTPDDAQQLWSYLALAGLVVFMTELVIRRFASLRNETL